MQLWKGRFKKELSKTTNDFNSSISFDSRMYKEDIEGSIAHATMLGRCGIIKKEEANDIVNGLKGILADIENGTLHIDMEAEDIHTFIEGELTKRIGDNGKRLHTSRSRNDQVAVDIKLYLKKEVVNVKNLVVGLIKVIADKAEKYSETVMPGYTHLQRAQPITFGHHLLAYGEMLLRDVSRLEDCLKRMDEMPLGSCALAGTTYPIDRTITAELLREDEIEYAEKHNIPLKINRETNYSKDKNLWHLSHEGLDLENPANEPMYNKEGFLELGVSPEQAPDKAEYVTLTFEKGVPTKLNGEAIDSVELIKELNKIGGRNGVGITDIVENRLVGMKARGVYETPGGTILYAAHAKLEEICLDKDTLHYKQNVANAFAELVYDGKWYTPLREALSAFVDSTQEYVTGDVKLKLYKGNIIDAGVTSPYSLYDEEIATFDEDQVYDQNDSAGFINLFGLPIKVRAKKGLIK